MTAISACRIARVRPLAYVSEAEHFFVANDAPDFDSEAGKAWTVVTTPFPGSPANAGSAPRSGWESGGTVEQGSFTFLAPGVPADVLGMAHNWEWRTIPAGRAVISPHRPSTRPRQAWSVRETR